MKASDVPIGAMFTYNGGLYWRIHPASTKWVGQSLVVALVITPQKVEHPTPMMWLTVFTNTVDVELYTGD